MFEEGAPNKIVCFTPLRWAQLVHAIIIVEEGWETKREDNL
jgi:hypothetical protein